MPFVEYDSDGEGYLAYTEEERREEMMPPYDLNGEHGYNSFGLQDGRAEQIWFKPRSENNEDLASYSFMFPDAGGKRFLVLWVDHGRVVDTSYSWVLNETAVRVA